MSPARSIPPRSFRAVPVLLIGGLALVAVALGGCGKRRMIKMDSDDGDAASNVVFAAPMAAAPASAPLLPPITLPVAPSATVATAAPTRTGWTDARKVRDVVGETLTASDGSWPEAMNFPQGDSSDEGAPLLGTVKQAPSWTGNRAQSGTSTLSPR